MIDHDLRGMDWVEVREDDLYHRELTDVKSPFYGLDASINCDVIVICEYSNVKRVDNHANAPLIHLSFDIECLPEEGSMPLASRSPVIMVAICFSPSFEKKDCLLLMGRDDVTLTNPSEGCSIIACNDEEDMLSKFVQLVKEYDPDVIVGYNSNDFDIPYISERMKLLRKKGTTSKLHLNIGRDETHDVTTKRFGFNTSARVTGRLIGDCLHMIRRDFSLKQYTLQVVAKELLNMEKLDVSPAMMEEAWRNGEGLQKVAEYCLRDAYLAMRLTLDFSLFEKYFAIARVSGTLPQDALERGQSWMVERLLMGAFRDHNRVMFAKPGEKEVGHRLEDELKGAAVLNPVRGLHENVVVLDYRSLYPSLIMAHNICYSTYLQNTMDMDATLDYDEAPNGARFVSESIQKGIVPEVLNRLLDERDHVRSMMKNGVSEERYRVLDAMQNAFKILLNSFYGYYGHAMARVYIPEMAGAVTSYGRENILKTRDIIEKEIREIDLAEVGASPHTLLCGLKVIYGDTDSVFVKVIPKSSSLENSNRKDTLSIEQVYALGNWLASYITKKLPPPMELNLESIARRALLITKKRYVLWSFKLSGDSFKDEIVTKGMETVRRDWCEMASITTNRVIEMVLKEGDIEGAVEYVKDVVRALKQIDPVNNPELLDKLILTRRYTKQTKHY